MVMDRTLVRDKVVMGAKRGMKPTRFRFKGNLRLGFRRGNVVEIVKFKKKSIR